MKKLRRGDKVSVQKVSWGDICDCYLTIFKKDGTEMTVLVDGGNPGYRITYQGGAVLVKDVAKITYDRRAGE